MLQVSIILYVINFFLKRNGIFCGFSKYYLNDILFIPVVIGIMILIEKKSGIVNFKIGVKELFIIIIFASVFFEGFLPLIDKRQTGDILDVGCYALGGIIYFFVNYKYFSA
ncbi:MAG: hypothetical protein Q8K66_13225 [Sediminibacterium sp.]|nr:hypothetical protein [Sediminibacterium sp.]MDP3128803.1 hypothetical protein [Sediminibacterium sp.]